MAEHRIVVPGVVGSTPITHPTLSNMSANDKYRLGLDIGASSVKYGFGSCQHGLQHFSKKELTHKTLDCLRETVAAILAECASEPGRENILAIGIGTPGTIDLASGKIAGVNPNLPFWSDRKPSELIPPDWAVPVVYDNDANLMCLGEAWLRGAKGLTVGITVGSGIGCGFVVDGKVFHGAHGWAMELGHVTSVPDGESCSCGRKGCLEAYASVDGIKRRILRDQEIPATSKDLVGLSGILDLRQKYQPVAKIIDEGMQILAAGIANLAVLVDPDRIVIGGGAMEGGLYNWMALKSLIETRLPSLNRAKTALEEARAGNRAGVLGAIVLASQIPDLQ